MLQQPSESLHKQASKRFALKKEIPILKQFRKIYKQYNQKPHPHLIQKEFAKEEVKLAELEVERLSNSLTLSFDTIMNGRLFRIFYQFYKQQQYNTNHNYRYVKVQLQNQFGFLECIIFNRKIKTDQNKSNNDDSEYSPFSQTTFAQDTIKKEKNQKELDFELLYQIYIEKQFTEDKKQRCIEWLQKN